MAALAIVLFIAALGSLLIEKNEEIKDLQPESEPEFKTPETLSKKQTVDSEFNQDVKITPDDTRDPENI